MSGRVHATTELAAWQDGETRQVYARYKQEHDHRMYFLADNTVEDNRKWLKEHVECFMPECTNRELIPRAGSNGRRDHFGHRSGAGGHGEESLSHEQGKHVLQQWLARQEGVLETQTERPLGRHAVIDVYASDGDFELAFEVQYSALSPSKWRHRHTVYDQHGIGDAWVWGHRGKQLQLDRPTSGRVRLSSTQREAAAAGQPLVWLNPERSEVLTGWVHKHVDTYSHTFDRHLNWGDGYDDHPGFQTSPGAEDEWCWVTVDALEDCELDAAGILTPTRKILHQQRTELQHVSEARRRRDQHWYERDQWRRDQMATPEIREQAWHQDTRRQRLIDEFGEIPLILRGDNSTTAGVWAHPEQWHAILYLELVHGAQRGHRFSVEDCYRALRHNQIVLDNPGKVIAEFLKQLERDGLIRLVSQRGRILEVWVQQPIAAVVPTEPKPAPDPEPEPDNGRTSTEVAETTQPAPAAESQHKSYPMPAAAGKQHRSYPVPGAPLSGFSPQPDIATQRRPWWKRLLRR